MRVKCALQKYVMCTEYGVPSADMWTIFIMLNIKCFKFQNAWNQVQSKNV